MASVSTFEDKDGLFNLKSETTSSQNNYDPLTCYKSQDYIFLPDQNNGNYSAGQINFDNLTLLNQFIAYSDSYLRIPLRVQCAAGGTPYTTSVALSFKNSVLDLITGLLVRSGDGQTLVNDPQNLHLLNKLKRLLDTTFDGIKSAEELQFEPDSVRSACNPGEGNWNAFSNATTVLPTNLPFTASATDNFNAGFSRRIRLFKNSSTFNAGIFDLIVYLPLYYVHEIFQAMNFPVVNIRFLFTFYTPITNSSAALTTNTPFLRASAVVSDPQCSISDTVRLYVKRVTFEPETSKMIASKMASGFTKRIQFNVIDSYTIASNQGSAATSVQENITPSVVAPVRVWRIVVPTGCLNSNTIPFSSIQPLSSGNLLCNNIPYYQSDLLTDEEFYDILRQNTIGKSKTNSSSSGLIPYSEWREFMRIHCFDVSRLGNRLADPSQPCSLFFRGQRENNLGNGGANPIVYPAADIIYLVERSQVCDIRFSNSAVEFRVSGSYI